MFKFENGAIVALSEEEEAAVMAAYEDYIRQQEKKPMTQSEVLDLLTKELVNTVNIPDKTSLRMKSYYPTFEEMAAKESEEDRTVKAGFKVYYEGELWKTRQNTVIQKQYPPSIDTASIWERIDEEHAGTVDDPIPYDQTMAVYNGKYYTYGGILYLCIRDSGNPLYADPETLIDNYFVVADGTGETQPGESGEGEDGGAGSGDLNDNENENNENNDSDNSNTSDNEQYEEWKPWDGVSGIYQTDKPVIDPNDGQVYISKIPNNVWGPPSQQPMYWDLYKGR